MQRTRRWQLNWQRGMVEAGGHFLFPGSHCLQQRCGEFRHESEVEGIFRRYGALEMAGDRVEARRLVEEG
jgi:hypothetical protein